MNSTMGKLNLNDLSKGAITAILAGVFMAVYGVVSTPGFDVFAVDWHSVLNLAVNGAVGGFVGYLAKNLLTDSQGKFLGGIR